MSLESNEKRYNELLAEYNVKYNEMVKGLRETSTPEYLIDHLAKSFLSKEIFKLGVLEAMIKTQKDYMIFQSRYGKK